MEMDATKTAGLNLDINAEGALHLVLTTATRYAETGFNLARINVTMGI